MENIFQTLESIPAHSAQCATRALRGVLHLVGDHCLYGDALAMEGDTGRDCGLGHWRISLRRAAGEIVSKPLDRLQVEVEITTQSNHTVRLRCNLEHGSVSGDASGVEVYIGSDESVYFYSEVIENLRVLGIVPRREAV